MTNIIQDGHKENEVIKLPPKSSIKSMQYDLFSQFMTNDVEVVSNTVEYWERIPKYFFTAAKTEKMRTVDGLAQSYSYEYTAKNKTGYDVQYKVKIHPALIEQSDGKDKAFFPTKTEETIEEVLKKIFTDQQYGIHDSKNTESWVRFSYSLVRRELYNMGNSLRYDQIKHSLEIMSKTVLTVYENGNEIYTGAILQDYCSVDRNKYLNDRDAQHVARLPVFISQALNTLQYRQYNYKRFMECKEQLTRYLYKRLIHRFTNASHTTYYHFMYSDIKQASGLLQQAREVDNRKKVISSLDELKQHSVILNYNIDEYKRGRCITDIKYTVYSCSEFVTEQKAANKRSNEGKMKAIKAGLIPNPLREYLK